MTNEWMSPVSGSLNVPLTVIGNPLAARSQSTALEVSDVSCRKPGSDAGWISN